MKTLSMPLTAHIPAAANGAGSPNSRVRARKNPAAVIAQFLIKEKSLSLTVCVKESVLSIFNVLSYHI